MGRQKAADLKSRSALHLRLIEVNVMANSTHFIEQEELMAYLDGELSVERAARVADHLEQCAECRTLAAEFRTLSQRLTEWQVEPAPSRLTERVAGAASVVQLNPQATVTPLPPQPRRRIFGLPRWVWATAGAACLGLLIGMVTIPTYQPKRLMVFLNPSSSPASEEIATTPSPEGAAPPTESTEEQQDKSAAGGSGSESPIVTGPMIARTASLTLLTRDFEKTRAGLEEVVRRHHGYDAQLTVSSETGSARRLTATFNVPADQLDAAISEIKQLAHVQQESQGGEEVTEQYVDLTARLSNARRTEKTLLDLLANRTGKLSDVLEVEQELARVREQIERMEAESKSLQNRVSFATLQVELHEEYEEELEMTPSLGRRLWNAVVEGFRMAADSVVGLALFLLNVGPFLLLWALILFWPARYVWRRVRAARAQK